MNVEGWVWEPQMSSFLTSLLEGSSSLMLFSLNLFSLYTLSNPFPAYAWQILQFPLAKHYCP